ncbi:hypothetical protein HDIA_0585 [Hartmannibacter diazotrophicus]|uniref:Tellurite resistance protein TerB n=1 Tax=Hartmannibacter diazotrophicus TaxID=1482074 RepID=A0A2C9D1L2_9HYPH|nr:cytoplasmic protein [Hartmannibacter diazotrophicus]SON54126.1 hypothetical protein HDIA_0585 [Hartmannibacter diazotrophicus]
MKSLSTHEALIYAMVTTSAADHAMSAAEFSRIRSTLALLPCFEGFVGDVSAIAQHCVQTLSEDHGIDSILDAIDVALTPPLKETAYALAVDVAAADVSVKQEELVFLEMMEDRFEIDKLVVAAIERSARVRHRRAGL